MELSYTRITYPFVYIALYFNTNNFSVVNYQADSLKNFNLNRVSLD